MKLRLLLSLHWSRLDPRRPPSRIARLRWTTSFPFRNVRLRDLERLVGYRQTFEGLEVTMKLSTSAT